MHAALVMYKTAYTTTTLSPFSGVCWPGSECCNRMGKSMAREIKRPGLHDECCSCPKIDFPVWGENRENSEYSSSGAFLQDFLANKVA